MNAHLILGCHGMRKYGFSLCKGVENVILDLSKIKDNKEEIYSYLDDHCKLFDAVSNDRNTINSAFQFLTSHKVFPKHIEDQIYDFFHLHKKCGHYMFLEPTDVKCR